MADPDRTARIEILASLAKSREELSQILDPPPETQAEHERAFGPGEFPRSRTMQMLMNGRGLGTVGAIAGGLLLARPALALRLLKLLPAGQIARLLAVRGLSALRSKHAKVNPT
jgi:hypothetical protein